MYSYESILANLFNTGNKYFKYSTEVNGLRSPETLATNAGAQFRVRFAPGKQLCTRFS